MTELLTGNLLVASSLVTDPIYAGSVCLVVHQDDENVIAVMLNRPMRPSPEAIQAMLGEQPGVSPANRLVIARSRGADPTVADSAPRRCGIGQARRFRGKLAVADASFRGPPFGTRRCDPPDQSVRRGGNRQWDLLRSAEATPGRFGSSEVSPYRLIVGHLGWETQQLESEIESGIWHVVPATVDTVFSAASQMWPRLIRRATSNSLARWIGVPDVIGGLRAKLIAEPWPAWGRFPVGLKVQATQSVENPISWANAIKTTKSNGDSESNGVAWGRSCSSLRMAPTASSKQKTFATMSSSTARTGTAR